MKTNYKAISCLFSGENQPRFLIISHYTCTEMFNTLQLAVYNEMAFLGVVRGDDS